MKISIITVCYNSQETIEKTIQSVISQDYPNIEYIIIDGNSSDKTMEIVNKYRNDIATVLSEKDEGLYFALNKGIAIATGDVIGILHSDDFYPSKDILSKISIVFKRDNCQGVYGDLEYVSKENNVIRKWIAGAYSKGLFLKGWMPPHPALFIKKEAYITHGDFNTNLRFSADYELMLRMIHKNNLTISYLPGVFVKMRVGGKSNLSISNRIKANIEDRLAWKLNGLKPWPITRFLKPLLKLRQFIK